MRKAKTGETPIDDEQLLRERIAEKNKARVEACAQEVATALEKHGCQLGCEIRPVYDAQTGLTHHLGQATISIKPSE